MNNIPRVNHADSLENLISNILDYILRNRIDGLLDPLTEIKLSSLHYNTGFKFGREGGINFDYILTLWKLLQYL